MLASSCRAPAENTAQNGLPRSDTFEWVQWLQALLSGAAVRRTSFMPRIGLRANLNLVLANL